MTEDIFIAKSAPEDALVQQLHTITYVTSDKIGVERAFTQGYGMQKVDLQVDLSHTEVY